MQIYVALNAFSTHSQEFNLLLCHYWQNNRPLIAKPVHLHWTHGENEILPMMDELSLIAG